MLQTPSEDFCRCMWLTVWRSAGAVKASESSSRSSRSADVQHSVAGLRLREAPFGACARGAKKREGRQRRGSCSPVAQLKRNVSRPVPSNR